MGQCFNPDATARARCTIAAPTETRSCPHARSLLTRNVTTPPSHARPRGPGGPRGRRRGFATAARSPSTAAARTDPGARVKSGDAVDRPERTPATAAAGSDERRGRAAAVQLDRARLVFHDAHVVAVFDKPLHQHRPLRGGRARALVDQLADAPTAGLARPPTRRLRGPPARPRDLGAAGVRARGWRSGTSRGSSAATRSTAPTSPSSAATSAASGPSTPARRQPPRRRPPRLARAARRPTRRAPRGHARAPACGFPAKGRDAGRVQAGRRAAPDPYPPAESGRPVVGERAYIRGFGAPALAAPRTMPTRALASPTRRAPRSRCASRRRGRRILSRWRGAWVAG